MSGWASPLCLIETGAGGRDLNVNPATVIELEKVSAPLVVVAVAGLYRTGKSYIMNLLANQTKGFSLGSTIQSKTKGVWVWCVDHPTKAGHTLVLLDTEGLGDVTKGDRNHDIHLFTLAVLLSSTLVYNSKGTIDNDALEKLHFVTEIAEHIKVKSEDEDSDEDFDRFFPDFVWAVRDFTLDLEKDGQPITSHEYLESSLELKRGSSKKVKDFNLPRECIRRYFPQRHCFTFPMPVGDAHLMSRLDELPGDKLEPEFREVAEEFVQHIYQNAPPKLTFPKSLKVSGSVLAGLTQAYVKAIQSGAIPCIENAVQQTAEMENTKAVKAAVQMYNQKIKAALSLPTDTADELSRHHERCNKDAIALFLSMAIFDEDQSYHKILMEQLGKEYKDWCEANEKASLEKCALLLKQLGADVDANIANGRYMTPGGYQTYSDDLAQVITNYNAAPKKGIKSKEALSEYQQSMAGQGSSILAADDRLTEEEKKRKDEERHRRESEQKQAAAEEARAQTEQRMKDQEKSYQDNIQQLEAKWAADIKAEREQQEKNLSARLAAQEKLLKEGFKEKADEMKGDIERLRKELEEAERQAQRGGGFFDMVLRPIGEGIINFVTGGFLK